MALFKKQSDYFLLLASLANLCSGQIVHVDETRNVGCSYDELREINPLCNTLPGTFVTFIESIESESTEFSCPCSEGHCGYPSQHETWGWKESTYKCVKDHWDNKYKWEATSICRPQTCYVDVPSNGYLESYPDLMLGTGVIISCDLGYEVTQNGIRQGSRSLPTPLCEPLKNDYRDCDYRIHLEHGITCEKIECPSPPKGCGEDPITGQIIDVQHSYGSSVNCICPSDKCGSRKATCQFKGVSSPDEEYGLELEWIEDDPSLMCHDTHCLVSAPDNSYLNYHNWGDKMFTGDSFSFECAWDVHLYQNGIIQKDKSVMIQAMPTLESCGLPCDLNQYTCEYNKCRDLPPLGCTFDLNQKSWNIRDYVTCSCPSGTCGQWYSYCREEFNAALGRNEAYWSQRGPNECTYQAQCSHEIVSNSNTYQKKNDSNLSELMPESLLVIECFENYDLFIYGIRRNTNSTEIAYDCQFQKKGPCGSSYDSCCRHTVDTSYIECRHKDDDGIGPRPMTDSTFPDWIEKECCYCEDSDFGPEIIDSVSVSKGTTIRTPGSPSTPSTPSTVSTPSSFPSFTTATPVWKTPDNCCRCMGSLQKWDWWDYNKYAQVLPESDSPKVMTEEKKEELGSDLPDWVDKDCCFCKDYRPPTPTDSSDTYSTPSTPSTESELPSISTWSAPRFVCCKCGHENAYDLPFGIGDYKLFGPEVESPSEIIYPKGLISQAGRIHNSMETCITLSRTLNGKKDKLALGSCKYATEFSVHNGNSIKVEGDSKFCWSVEKVSKTGQISKPVSKIGLDKCNGKFEQMFSYKDGQLRFSMDSRFCVALQKGGLVLRFCDGLEGDEKKGDMTFGLSEFL